MQDELFQMLLKENDISWQQLLYELIKTEKMDPWDIDISQLTHKFIDLLKEMKNLNLKISGKFLLTSALLLKIKSVKFLGEDISEFDRLLAPDAEALFDEDVPLTANPEWEQLRRDKPQLMPRTPQPRKRKVSIYDLVEALQQAMKVKKRRLLRDTYEMEFEMPDKHFDIMEKIEQIMKDIDSFYFINVNGRLMFSQLVPSKDKEAIVYTFLPLLHLTTAREIDLVQDAPFEDFHIQRVRKIQTTIQKDEAKN